MTVCDTCKTVHATIGDAYDCCAVSAPVAVIPSIGELPDWAQPRPSILVDSPSEADYVLAIDVSNLAWRAIMGNPSLKAPDGVPSGHVFGSLKSILAVVNKVRAGRWCLAFCYDGPGAKTERQKDLPVYKADRNHDMENPCPAVEAVLEHLPGLHLRAPGREGDDAIAWVANTCSDAGLPALIYSGDSDTWGLINATTGVLSPNLGKYVGIPEIYEKCWVEDPKKVYLAKSIFGDSDVPSGVPGILKKKIAPYLNTPGVTDPDSLYAALKINSNQGLTPAAAAKMWENRAGVENNFKVVLPRTTGFDSDTVWSAPGDRAALISALTRYGIATLMGEGADKLLGREFGVQGAGYGQGWLST